MSRIHPPKSSDAEVAPETLAEMTELAETAAEWRLLGLLLERPRFGWRDEIEALAAEIGDASLIAAASRARDAGEGGYLALLGPGGRVSPREVRYRPMQDPGWVLADVARYYDAFAYRPRAEDPLDHVAVETGFVAYLLLKEAYAIATCHADAAASTAAARHAFVEEHLGGIAVRIATGLQGAASSYLAEVARLLAARVPASVATAGPLEEPADGWAGCSACD